MTAADKREDVMFAQRVHLDILNQHHLAGIRGKQGVIDNRSQILLVAPGQKGERCGRSFRRV